MASNRKVRDFWIACVCTSVLLANFVLDALPTAAAEPKTADATYGTPKIDAEIEPMWGKTPVVHTNRQVKGVSTLPPQDAARAKVRVLWDEQHLYVLCEVEDSRLSATGAELWQHDSVEVFIDENNSKAGQFDGDDCQYRVNYQGKMSGGRSYQPGAMVAKVREIEGGYVVELAIKLRVKVEEDGKQLGFDIQVNDDAGSGIRESIMKWCDRTDRSWYDTSGYGTLELRKNAVVGDEDKTKNNGNEAQSSESSVNG